ncbi:MAG: hypothetical protein HUJ29_11265 [Gammaproteobacteria bacterium]|nr:hypothetical protein [Gammaproteobacteria bacterium]
MKKSVMKGMVAGLALAASAPMTAMAGEGSTSVLLGSDWVLRGVPQTGGPVLQAAYDYDFGNGAAVGIWGSNISSGVEVDVYATYSGESGDFGYTIGYFTYNVDFVDQELAALASYGDFSFGFWNSMQLGGTYTEVGYDMDVSGVGVGLHYGIGTVADYAVSASYPFGDYEGSLAYTSHETAGTNFVLSVSTSF